MRVRNYEVFFGHLLIFSVGTVLLSVVGEKQKQLTDWEEQLVHQNWTNVGNLLDQLFDNVTSFIYGFIGEHKGAPSCLEVRVVQKTTGSNWV